MCDSNVYQYYRMLTISCRNDMLAMFANGLGLNRSKTPPINPNRRWPWMGKRGKVLEEYYS